MDAKNKQITYQVAWKGAVELVANGIVELTTDDVGAEVKELADALSAPLFKVLEGYEADAPSTTGRASSTTRRSTSTTRSQSGTARSSSKTDDRWELTEEACPNEGCDGVLLHNTTDRGPEWQCSKVQRVKRGTKWVDVGTCDYMDWGANSNQ